jgi:serine/threonine protein kinase
MATVFLGALEGDLGFRQVVAIKRPHPHLLEDHAFRDALLREARLAAGIHHANVVDVRDVEAVGDAVQLVMDYIEGASLGELVAALAREGKTLPPGIALRIVLDACAGLHAAHEMVDDDGAALGLVHRDVSPQNVLVGVDGIARVTDFGIAKCIEASDPGTSRETLKGKAGYMAPEYVRGKPVDRRADVFALGVVAWEALCGKRLFRGQSDAETLERVLSTEAPVVSATAPDLAAFDAPVARALAKDPADRFATTEELGRVLAEAAAPGAFVASAPEVGRFVRDVFGGRLDERRRTLRDARGAATSTPPPPPGPRRLEVAAPDDPGNESTTVPERRPARAGRSLGMLWLGGAVLAVGAGTAWIMLSHPTPPTTTSTSSESASTAASPVRPVPAPVSPDTSFPGIPMPASAASGDVPPRSRGPGRGRGRPGHAPPPNPYPSGP